MDKLVMCTLPDSTAAEAFRILRTSLSHAVEAGHKSLLFVSTWGSDGKSLVCANTAAAFAQSGRRTLIIDGDLRRPTISHLFGSSGEVGLMNAVQGSTPLAECIRSTSVDLLYLLPTGPMLARPGDFLTKAALSKVLSTLHQQFDILIIDSPPITFFAEATVYATVSDGVVMVINAKRWKGPEEMKVKRDLDRAGVRILGVVLNGDDDESNSGYRYNYYYYNKSSYGNGRKRLFKLPRLK